MFIKRPRLVVFFLSLTFLSGLVFHKNIGRVLFSYQYREIIEEKTRGSRLDPKLVAALIYVESGFNPRAVSKKGARGLMQLMPDTAEWITKQKGEEFEISKLYIPRENLDLGIWYLHYLAKEFQGNSILMLAAYNGGWVRVKEWVEGGLWQGSIRDLKNIPFPETRKYVARVIRVYQIYRYLY